MLCRKLNQYQFKKLSLLFGNAMYSFISRFHIETKIKSIVRALQRNTFYELKN